MEPASHIISYAVLQPCRCKAIVMDKVQAESHTLTRKKCKNKIFSKCRAHLIICCKMISVVFEAALRD
jgi:hypothetical protein